jgi:anti-sigma factor RsiW
MFTRMTLVLAGALMFVTPALAQNSFQGSGYAPQWSGSAPVPAGKIHRRAPVATQGWTNGAGDVAGALAAEGQRVKALQALIHRRLPGEEAPSALHARVAASVGGLRRSRAQPSWRALAASIALTAMVASSSTWVLFGPQSTQMTEDSLVSGHIRSLMAPRPIDVVSSDQHTVKPWFNGRVPGSPRVVDLTPQNFPLLGGRVDVIEQTPVPTLVYRHRQHLISVTEMTAAGHVELASTRRTINGYNVLQWNQNGVTYWAVSDLALSELEDFARRFRTTAAEL